MTNKLKSWLDEITPIVPFSDFDKLFTVTRLLLELAEYYCEYEDDVGYEGSGKARTAMTECERVIS